MSSITATSRLMRSFQGASISDCIYISLLSQSYLNYNRLSEKLQEHLTTYRNYAILLTDEGKHGASPERRIQRGSPHFEGETEMTRTIKSETTNKHYFLTIDETGHAVDCSCPDRQY